MANDNQNQVLDEQTDAVDEKSTKRVRKTKPKASESGSTASLFGIAPYQPKKNSGVCWQNYGAPRARRIYFS